MQLPYRLHRRSDADAATALLLLSHDPAALLALCADLAHDPPPRAFLTADGFLLLLDAPTAKHWPQTVRLRQIADFLLLPVDAELSPQLHDDEAGALTRERGLVFLPGGRVLEFASTSPIEMTALLTAGPVRRDGWEELPAARRFPDHLSITLELPLDDPTDVVDGGGDGVGSEELTPEGRGPIETAANRARLGLGRAMARFGRALGLDALRRAGERMAERAAEAVPQLAQGLYGAQGRRCGNS